MARLRIPEVLTASEQEALLRVPNPRYPAGERNRLLLRVMLNAGLRLSEAINLRWPDTDLTTGRVHVKLGKGGEGPGPVARGGGPSRAPKVETAAIRASA